MLPDLLGHADLLARAGPGLATAVLADAPDFSDIEPNSNGIPKAGVLFTLAQILLWGGLGIMFLILVGSVITWGAGHVAGGIHISERAKGNALRAMFCGIVLSAAGGIWTWLTAL